MSQTLNESQARAALEDSDGNQYVARISGVQIAVGPHDEEVYVTDKENVLVYDVNNTRYWIADDPAEDLRFLHAGEYSDAMHALGETPVIDLDV